MVIDKARPDSTLLQIQMTKQISALNLMEVKGSQSFTQLNEWNISILDSLFKSLLVWTENPFAVIRWIKTVQA